MAAKGGGQVEHGAGSSVLFAVQQVLFSFCGCPQQSGPIAVLSSLVCLGCLPPVPADPAAQAPTPFQIPFTVVFTKLDKRKKGSPPAEENIAAFEAAVADA